MIKYLVHKKIDKAKWDKCISASPNGLIYAYSWYLDAICPGWEALIRDDYHSVMPLTVRKKYNFRYTYCPPYTQQLGLFSTSAITEKDVENFLLQIPKKFKYVEMNLNEQNLLTSGLYKTLKRVTHLLSLEQPYKSIYSNYSKQTKRNLKKGKAASLIISKNAPTNKIIELFINNGGKMYASEPLQYEILEKLIHICINRGVGQSWGVYTKENELCAGAFFLESNKRVIFLFSGANIKAYETQALTFLFNQFMEENAGRDLIFDFEGGLEPNLGRFYKGFGSKEVGYLQIRENRLPFPLKSLKNIKDKIRNLSNK